MERDFHIPDDRHYNPDHLWLSRDEESGEVTAGMDELGLDSLGELAYLTLPDVGTSVEMGKPMGSLEAAKMTGELIAPISGVVRERNESVLHNPTLVNESPYDSGWLVRIEPVRWEDEASELVSGEELADWIGAEIERFERQGILG